LVDLSLVVGVALFSVIPILLLFLVVRGRGDLVRLWSSNVVPYFKRMRWNKPLRLKVRRDIGQTMNKDIVKLIDSVMFEQGSTEKKRDPEVSDSLLKDWKILREHPEHYSIWATFFKRAWRLPNGLSGRWVFMYHLFPLEEMTKRFGRHQLIQGVLLPQPISVHAPPTREQWCDLRLKEDVAKGIRPDQKRIKAYVKEWRKVVKEKWLNIFFHPTTTVTAEAQMLERLQGFGSLVAINAYAMRVMGEKLAKYDYMEGFATSAQKFMDVQGDELHKYGDRLGKKDIVLREQDRAMKELRIPVKLSPDFAPMPSLPYTPVPVEKPSRLKTQLPENWVAYLCVFIGFFGLVWGMFTSGVAQLVVGAFLLGLGAFMLWREGKKVKLPESVRETVAEQKESLGEQGV